MVDEHNSAEILDWAQLINVEMATGAFHSTGTSSVVIEALSWQVLRPLSSQKLSGTLFRSISTLFSQKPKEIFSPRNLWLNMEGKWVCFNILCGILFQEDLFFICIDFIFQQMVGGVLKTGGRENWLHWHEASKSDALRQPIFFLPCHHRWWRYS